MWVWPVVLRNRFQFLGIPPKGEHGVGGRRLTFEYMFPISRDPPEGGTIWYALRILAADYMFPISRDPPEGGTCLSPKAYLNPPLTFPISRDPPEGGTFRSNTNDSLKKGSFQFLGIPPKGELPVTPGMRVVVVAPFPISRDPPEGGTGYYWVIGPATKLEFPISRDPPEGGTSWEGQLDRSWPVHPVSNF